MDVVAGIDRLDRPTSEQVARYVAASRPFICTGVLDGTPFCHYDEPAAALAGFARGVISFDPSGNSNRQTVAEYFARPEVDRGSVSASLPDEVASQVVDVARASPMRCNDVLLVVRLGRTGCVVRFHCDMDCRDNFLVQAFGTKRVCLVSPDQTQIGRAHV